MSAKIDVFIDPPCENFWMCGDEIGLDFLFSLGWCLGPEVKENGKTNQKKDLQHNNKVASLAKQFESEHVIDKQPSKGRPLPHSDTDHVERTPPSKTSSKHPSRQVSQESPMRKKDGSSHHSTPASHHSSHQSRGQRTGGKVEMCETATSPDGYYRPDKIIKEFEVDYPIEKTAPKQKTKIVYDLGSPQMNTQGINASIPITTDKYTYTITSVLSSMSNQQNSTSPLSSPTSGNKRPISSCKIIQPNPNPKIGKKVLIR